MQSATILWVQDDYDGPVNGMVEYNGEELWFSRVNTPQFKVDISQTINDNLESKERTYILYRLSKELFQVVTENHLLHCEETGSPKNHGDPVKIKRKKGVVKMKPEVMKTLVSPDKEEIEAEPRSLAGIKIFGHKISPDQVTGEFITCIKETAFSNYLVPRRCEMVD